MRQLQPNNKIEETPGRFYFTRKFMSGRQIYTFQFNYDDDDDAAAADDDYDDEDEDEDENCYNYQYQLKSRIYKVI